MRLPQYLKESRQEMKKVVWPSRRETTNHTLAVIIISLAVAAFFMGADYLLSRGLEALLIRF
jgi:preprotein translocase subunit SecE